MLAISRTNFFEMFSLPSAFPSKLQIRSVAARNLSSYARFTTRWLSSVADAVPIRCSRWSALPAKLATPFLTWDCKLRGTKRTFLGLTCSRASGDAAQSCEVDPLSITSQRRALLASFQSDLPRDKCRNVSFFLSNFTLGDNGYLNRICSLLLFDEREVTSLYRRLSRRLATYNGYKENGWSSLPSQPAAFDDYVSWKVLPVVLRILDVCDKDDAEVYRGEFRRHWKMEGENLMDLMDAFEKLSVSFLGWPQRYSCLYCSSVALEALGMASGDLL